MKESQLQTVESRSEGCSRSLAIQNKLSEARDNYRKSGNHQYTYNTCFQYGEYIEKVDLTPKDCARRQFTFDQLKLETYQSMNSPVYTPINFERKSFESISDQQSFDKDSKEDGQADYSDIMIKRWESHISKIPQVDKHDILNHNLNMNGGESFYEQEVVNQPVPEYSQLSYLRLRSNEEVFQLFNYLDTKLNSRYQNFIAEYKDNQIKLLAMQTGRTKGIQKIIFLHQKRKYKIETLFHACNIFDRYLAIVGHWNFPTEDIMSLACISLLMAIKVEEDMCPNFHNMTLLFTNLEKQGMTRDKLVELEQDILFRFGFEFNYPGPIESMQRFLRLTDLNKDANIESTCLKILKFQLKFAVFLNYRPSQISACSVILANNFHNNKPLEDTSIWYNKDTIEASGYSVEDLEEPLNILSQHLQQKSQILTSQDQQITKE